MKFTELQSLRRAETLHVQDTLNLGTVGAETLYDTMAEVRDADHYIIDMKRVRSIDPCGLIALVLVARYCTELSDKRVIFTNFQQQIYSYLKQLNFFYLAKSWLTPIGYFDNDRYGDSNGIELLALETISEPNDVDKIVSRIEKTRLCWLNEDRTGNVQSILSELCANVYQHSKNIPGYVLVQANHSELQKQITIRLSVGDLGRGIQDSLLERHGEFGNEPMDYIRAAMNGKTSRSSGRGGLGLRRVRDIVTAHNGYMHLRSETAAVTYTGSELQEQRGLRHMLGTQVSIEMCLKSEFRD